jgi:hypothetical protein
MDNLIAAGKVKPMIVVMPNGNAKRWKSSHEEFQAKELSNA